MKSLLLAAAGATQWYSEPDCTILEELIFTGACILINEKNNHCPQSSESDVSH